MKILVFGSLNIDRTYIVDHFVRPCETLSATKMEIFCGGKGFNQAVALSRAGCEVYFAGAIGDDGDILHEALQQSKIKLDFLQRIPGPSGHAIIQVNPEGQNCILISTGANGCITCEYVDYVLSNFGEGDLIVLQNEIPHVDYIIRCAKKRGMMVAFNPSPYNERVDKCNIHDVDYLLINEVEGAEMTGEKEIDCIQEKLRAEYPATNIILTLGERGVKYLGHDGLNYCCGIYAMSVVDTTAAGDTFTGYFLAEIIRNADIQKALGTASIASGIAVSRKGASPSIPFREEVDAIDCSMIRAFIPCGSKEKAV